VIGKEQDFTVDRHRLEKSPELKSKPLNYRGHEDRTVGRIDLLFLLVPMKKMQSANPVASKGKIVLFSVLAAIPVLAASLVMQWLVYDDWLHQTGPLRIVGTSIAALVTFIFALRWQISVRERQLEMVRRLEMILGMNDRIRNALQAIECVTYVAQPEATESVRQSVNVIDSVLKEVLAESGQAHGTGRPKAVDPDWQNTRSKSA
jgi:hypothetical protein